MNPLIYVAVSLVLIIPLWRILKRAGLSPYGSLWALAPGLGHLIVLGILAFAAWPARTQSPTEVR